MMQRGAFITVEGGDGSGKTTAMNYLCDILKAFGYNIERTREPGGTDVGEKIRDIIVNDNINSVTETLLFAASRSEHVEKKIKPAMQEGKTVVSDRFYDSSFAYQGFGRGHLMEVQFLKQFVLNGFSPDYTLFLDVEPEIVSERLLARCEEQNRLDKEGLEFRMKCLQGYVTASTLETSRMVMIDANGAVEEVQQQIYQWVVEKFVPNNHRPLSYFNATNDQIAMVLGLNKGNTQLQKDMFRLYVTEKIAMPRHRRVLLGEAQSSWRENEKNQ